MTRYRVNFANKKIYTEDNLHEIGKRGNENNAVKKNFFQIEGDGTRGSTNFVGQWSGYNVTYDTADSLKNVRQGLAVAYWKRAVIKLGHNSKHLSQRTVHIDVCIRKNLFSEETLKYNIGNLKNVCWQSSGAQIDVK